MLEHRTYALIAAFFAIAVPGIVFWVLWTKFEQQIRDIIAWYAPQRFVFFLLPLLMIALTWLVARLSFKLLNLLIMSFPMMRRKIRPWLRRKGFNLLPPRRRVSPDEILEIDPSYGRSMRQLWTSSRPWLWRIASVTITLLIFAWMIVKISEHWRDPGLADCIQRTSVGSFLLGAGMFAVFLFGFRAMVWRSILTRFGHALPITAAARIWVVSELARYLPGSIWQVIGRVVLVKPYGVSGTICSTSQIFELTLFLGANVIVAVACLLVFGAGRLDGAASAWLYTALALVPFLAVTLHPRVFYRLSNALASRLGKPPIAQGLTLGQTTALVLWTIVGLAWQTLAIWLVIGRPLNLPFSQSWTLAGPYCLAWVAGFLAIWAPGGLGVREVVLMASLLVVASPYLQGHASLTGIAAALSLLLRLWTLAGELVYTAVASLADHRGLVGMVSGSMPQAAPPVSEAPSSGTAPRGTPPTAPAQPTTR